MAIETIKTISEIKVGNRGNFVRVEHKRSNGKEFVDIRTWFVGDDDELHPTSKGVMIPAEKLAEVQKALEDATKIPEIKAAAK